MIWYPIRTRKQVFAARDEIIRCLPHDAANAVRVQQVPIGAAIVTVIRIAGGLLWAPMQYEERVGQTARKKVAKRRSMVSTTPGYLFATIPLHATMPGLAAVIAGTLRVNGEAARVDESELADIAAIDRTVVAFGTARVYEKDQIIKIAVGKLAGFKGRVARIDGDNLDVIVDWLGRPNAVRVSSGRVEAA